MTDPDYILHKHQSKEDLPFNLLLLADETTDAIEKYIHQSDVYSVTEKGHQQPIGVVALYRISDTELEIKNIAVAETHQQKGIGSYLIREIKKISATGNYKDLIVGTPDVAVKQISFYEKNGFNKYAVKKDFFIENYTMPIVEDGITLRDMVMLKMKI